MMNYVLLGRSGLRVSELCLGTMTFGDDWGWGADEATSRQMFDAFVEQGGNFLDTANGYTNGTSEELIGRFVGAERDRFVIATKYTANMHPSDPNGGGNHRKSLVHSVEGSLRRLDTDYLDLLWVHMWDFTTPVEEVMRALDDLVRSGKVLYVGISDAPAWIVSEANVMADLRGWSRFVGLQIEYSLVERAPERDLLPMAEARELAVLDWSPLASGVLTGKHLGSGDGATSDASGASDDATMEVEAGSRIDVQDADLYDKYRTPRAARIARTVVDVAEAVGRPPAQVALNWIRQQPGPTHIPIVGARKLRHVEDNLACLEWTLEAEHLDRLDAVSRISLDFPHDFLTTDTVKSFVFGESFDRVQSPYSPQSRRAH